PLPFSPIVMMARSDEKFKLLGGRVVSQSSGESLLKRLWQESYLLLLVAMLVSMPLLMPFTHGASGRALRNGLCESMGLLLLVALLTRVDTRSGVRGCFALVRSGINLPVALFLLWAVAGGMRAPDRAFA